jgi:hypothetical protein
MVTESASHQSVLIIKLLTGSIMRGIKFLRFFNLICVVTMVEEETGLMLVMFQSERCEDNGVSLTRMDSLLGHSYPNCARNLQHVIYIVDSKWREERKCLIYTAT